MDKLHFRLMFLPSFSLVTVLMTEDMNDFFFLLKLFCLLSLTSDVPRVGGKEVAEVGRRGEGQKWFLLPSTIMMWHFCLLSLACLKYVSWRFPKGSNINMKHVSYSWPLTSPLSYWLQVLHSVCYQCLSLLDGPHLDHEKHSGALPARHISKIADYFKWATSPHYDTTAHHPDFYV